MSELKDLIPANYGHGRGNRKTVVTASVSPECRDWIDSICKNKNQSRSFVAGKFLEYLYEQSKSKEPPSGQGGGV